MERDRLADGVTGALKISGAEAGSVVDERTSAETAPITARIYDGIPAEDLAAAGRVLTLITERANAEFAALTK